MKKPCAISSWISATPVCKLLLFLVIAIVPLPGSADDNALDTRYNALGHRMMCTCKSEPAAMGPKGCREVLLKCTHYNCEASDRMRRELRAALQKGDTDDAILSSFVQEYGTSVLVVPRMSDIPRRLWIAAFAVLLAAAASIVLALVRKRQSRPAMVTTPVSDLRGIDPDALRQVREDTENDDQG